MAEMAAKLTEKVSSFRRLRIVRAACEHLPFHASSFDFVVGQFLCCSVADPTAAIREMHRVLRPRGQLRLLEHVRSTDPRLGRMQDALAPLWSQFAFGCRLNNDLKPALMASPFRELRIEPTALGLLESVTAFA
jgi:ubiquinone/menaquinone biosynthesis C-methylase UbiE